MSELPQPATANHDAILPDSLKAAIHAARERARQTKTTDIDLPGFGAVTVRGRYQAVSWKTTKAITKRNETQPEDLRELYIAADTLIAASLDVLAVIDGTDRSLGVTLGLPLARWLSTDANPSIAETDRQAVLTEVFIRESQLMQHYGEFMVWQQGVNLAVDEEAKGNSGAAS